MTVEIYSQRDPRWSADHLGLPQASRLSTIGDYGCAITAIAQMRTLMGFATTPPDVQATLLQAGAFRRDQTLNLVNWPRVPVAYPQFQYNGRHDYPSTPTPTRVLNLITDRLALGRPTIIYVDASPYVKGLQQHFVLVVGQSETGDLYIDNPWNGRQQDLRPYGRTDAIAICGVILLDSVFDASRAA